MSSKKTKTSKAARGKREPLVFEYLTAPSGAAIADKISYGDGATRTADGLDYSLVPPEGVDAAARRFELGAPIHGRHNWKRGLPVEVVVSRIQKHLNNLLRGREDRHTRTQAGNVDAIVCNAMMLAWYWEHHPDAFLRMWDEMKG